MRNEVVIYCPGSQCEGHHEAPLWVKGEYIESLSQLDLVWHSTESFRNTSAKPTTDILPDVHSTSYSTAYVFHHWLYGCSIIEDCCTLDNSSLGLSYFGIFVYSICCHGAVTNMQRSWVRALELFIPFGSTQYALYPGPCWRYVMIAYKASSIIHSVNRNTCSDIVFLCETRIV